MGTCEQLQAKAKNGEFHIGVEDKRGEDYRAPTPPAYVAFSGTQNNTVLKSEMLAATN